MVFVESTFFLESRHKGQTVVLSSMDDFNISMVESHKSKISIDAGIQAQYLEAQVWELFTQTDPHKIFCGYCSQEIGEA